MWGNHFMYRIQRWQTCLGQSFTFGNVWLLVVSFKQNCNKCLEGVKNTIHFYCFIWLQGGLLNHVTQKCDHRKLEGRCEQGRWWDNAWLGMEEWTQRADGHLHDTFSSAIVVGKTWQKMKKLLASLKSSSVLQVWENWHNYNQMDPNI